MKSEELKIKIRSLAYESKIIRGAENKLKNKTRVLQSLGFFKAAERQDNSRISLYHHRTSNIEAVSRLKSESRLSLLAYGYIRGKPYRLIEQTTKTPINLSRLKDLIRRFGGIDVTIDSLTSWVGGAYEQLPQQWYQGKLQEYYLPIENKFVSASETP